MHLKKELVINRVAGQTVILDLSKDESDDKMVSTNGTGAFLLEQIQKGCDTDGLISAMLNRYDVDEKRAREHVALFLNGLRELGFLAD